ncbi:PAS domain S-box protein [Magnetospirillum sp. UT-4]|uniref:sensor histidine kinase n=1 Tax=Magnetospirillum sp. UT-4 TaxID=2681467 RepID=UPI001384A238|nr:PAS domain S-box protein [Magnetospirillum sp. UT-4]CAA7620248.1 putative Histidine kinase [Magnetospirillum sp. UT-4]
MQGANDGLWDWNLDTGEVYYSARWKEMLGYREDELEATLATWARLVHPDDKARALALVDDYVAGRAPRYEIEFRMRHKDGVWIDLLSRGKLARSDDGQALKPRRLVGTHTDISETKRIQKILAEERSQLRAMLDNIPDLAWLKDAEGHFIAVNERFAQAVDIRRDLLVGKTDFAVWPRDVASANAFAENDVLASCRPMLSEARLEIDGRPRWFEIQIAPICGENGVCTGTTGIAHDITGRKEAEARLLRTIDELTRSNTELERFAYVASHDLQEPLRNIVSFSQLLERQLGERLTASEREYLDFIVNGGLRMRDLVNDLLDYSRAGRADGAYQDVSLADAVARAEANLQAALRESGATLCREGDATLRANPLQMAQLFQNLIGNAVKFRRPDIAPVVTIAARPVDSDIEIAVTDNGIGIAPPYLDQVFVIFKRLHAGGEFPGTGMGLAICKRIVESHGGSIRAESDGPGTGTTIRIRLPAA